MAQAELPVHGEGGVYWGGEWLPVTECHRLLEEPPGYARDGAAPKVAAFFFLNAWGRLWQRAPGDPGDPNEQKRKFNRKRRRRRRKQGEKKKK